MSDPFRTLMRFDDWAPPTPEMSALIDAGIKEGQRRARVEEEMTALLLSAEPGPYGPH